MPVDFTNKKKEKSNYEYLREILKGNEEGLEFLEGLSNEHHKECDKMQEDYNNLENENEDLMIEKYKRDSAVDYTLKIDTLMGNKEFIQFNAPNLACSAMMSELKYAIERGVPVNTIENILRAL